LKAVREKYQAIKSETYQKNSRFLNRNYKSQESWNDVLQVLNENNCQSRLPYPVKLIFIIEGEKCSMIEKKKKN
jgi:hypothetical protein